MNVPEIRFKGFKGEWSSFRLSEIFIERHEISTITENLPQLSFTIDEGIIRPEDRKTNKRDFLIKDKCSKKYLVTNKGDIIYNPANVIHGAIHMNALCNGVVSPIYKIFISNANPKFMECIVRNPLFISNLSKLAEGTVVKLKTLKPETFLNKKVFLTSDKEEQRLISSVIIHIDDEIKNIRENILFLKHTKAGCLKSMFPKEGDFVPKVRFKGFEGEWEKLKLSNIAKRITRKNKNLQCVLPLTISSIEGLVSQENYFNNLVVGANMENYYLLKKGEFAYNKSYSNGYPFGSVKRLDMYVEGILSTLYIVFAINKSVNSDFLTVFFDTSLWYKEVSERAAEGARNHGLLNITAEDFMDIDIFMPKDIAEQQKIGQFFQSLDKKISLETQRLEKLKHIKATCLDKMFV